jgi:hypothetical protein
MTQRFEKAYNALYNAFMNDTLAPGTCTACAVGNIVADAMGNKVGKLHTGEFHCDVNNEWWKHLFITTGRQTIYKLKDNGSVKHYRKKMFDLTGYRWYELAQVEYAFEKNTKIKTSYYDEHTEQEIMKDQFNGLMAVMDVLIQLDEVAEGQKYKDTFKKKREKFLV